MFFVIMHVSKDNSKHMLWIKYQVILHNAENFFENEAKNVKKDRREFFLTGEKILKN